MANIPVTRNKPVTGHRPVRRGQRVMPSENTGEKTQGSPVRRERRRLQDRRKKQLKVRFERRNQGSDRRKPARKAEQEQKAQPSIGRHINTTA